MNKVRNPKGLIHYRAGGNPPELASLYGDDGERLAFWPAGYAPTQDSVSRVYACLIEGREEGAGPVGRHLVRELLDSPV